jgi:hypothetical protein
VATSKIDFKFRASALKPLVFRQASVIRISCACVGTPHLVVLRRDSARTTNAAHSNQCGLASDAWPMLCSATNRTTRGSTDRTLSTSLRAPGISHERSSRGYSGLSRRLPGSARVAHSRSCLGQPVLRIPAAMPLIDMSSASRSSRSSSCHDTTSRRTAASSLLPDQASRAPYTRAVGLVVGAAAKTRARHSTRTSDAK